MQEATQTRAAGVACRLTQPVWLADEEGPASVNIRRYMHVSPLMTAGLLVAAGLLTAACGGSFSPTGSTSPNAVGPDSAAKIVPEMQAAFKSANSVHITGTVKAGSQQVSLDVSFQGSNAAGTVNQAGKSYSILVAAGKAYVKVNPDFLGIANLPASDCSTMCGKYVAIPLAQMSQLSGSFSLSSIGKQFVNALPSSVTQDSKDSFQPTTFNGQPALKFTQGRYTIDVASSGPPYVLYLADSAQGSLTFSQWNSVPTITPPPAADVISL